MSRAAASAWHLLERRYNECADPEAPRVERLGLKRRSRAIPSKVFVGNLSFRTSKEELTEIAAAAGTVVDVYMPADRATGKPRGFAFVEFGSQAEAEAAVSQLNGREVGGRTLKANLAEDRPPRRPTGPRPFDGPREGLDGPSFFAVEGRFSKPKGSRRGTRGRKRSL